MDRLQQINENFLKFLIENFPNSEQEYIQNLLAKKASIINDVITFEKGYDVRQNAKILEALVEKLLDNQFDLDKQYQYEISDVEFATKTDEYSECVKFLNSQISQELLKDGKIRQGISGIKGFPSNDVNQLKQSINQLLSSSALFDNQIDINQHYNGNGRLSQC